MMHKTIKKKPLPIRVWNVFIKKGIKGIIKGAADRFKKKTAKDVIPFYTKEIKTENTNEKTLPVSVIIPTIKSRNRFLKEFVIPSIENNNPKEIIIIEDEDLNAQEKRNKGAELSTQEYLFFCDDDIILPKNYLSILYSILSKRHDIGYVYTDYQALVLNENHPVKGNYYWKSRKFSEELLRKNNYISTMALMKKDIFPGFDPNIKRSQDWDLWLTLLERGIKGEYIEETGFLAFYLDDGITSVKTDLSEMKDIIKRKHHL